MHLLSRAGLVVLVGCLVVTGSGTARAQSDDAPGWNPDAAASYLDARLDWWMDWPTAARDHGTFCVSCHTATPYALARTALRTGSTGVTAGAVERRLLENVETRVTAWQEVEPFYSDEEFRAPKTSESRGTEAILNTLILANRDADGSGLSRCVVRTRPSRPPRPCLPAATRRTDRPRSRLAPAL